MGNASPLDPPPVSASGYPIERLMVGSEGTLAVIVEAAMRFVPIPKLRCLGTAKFNVLSEAGDAIADIMGSGCQPQCSSSSTRCHYCRNKAAKLACPRLKPSSSLKPTAWQRMLLMRIWQRFRLSARNTTASEWKAATTKRNGPGSGRHAPSSSPPSPSMMNVFPPPLWPTIWPFPSPRWRRPPTRFTKWPISTASS